MGKLADATPHRRALGQWSTALPVAELVLAALAPLDPRWRVLDPTCGEGAFLGACRAAGLRSLTGLEIDRQAAAHARTNVPGATIVDGDLLSGGRTGSFELVIGNPPWVRAGSVDPKIKRERAALIAADWPELDRTLVEGVARLADVAATCLLRALRLVEPGGRLALVMSTALLDADGAAPLWRAVQQVASVRALITAPGERWFADAAVNPMIVLAERCASTAPPRLLRLAVPTSVASRARGLDAVAACCDERRATADASAWGPALRAPAAWFAWREAAGDAVVPLRALADVRRGITTGANDVFYLKRTEATALRLEPRYLADVVRSPFNGSPAPIAIAPGESPVVALALPADATLARVPRIAAWLRRHADAAERTSVRRRDPWWSLPVDPARLFLAKAYGPRFVQRLADLPMLADQRVYALTPRAGVSLPALAAVLNALPTALALESLGRASMGFGAVEWTVADAMELPVLDVRRADRRSIAALARALAGFGHRPIDHVRVERGRVDRIELDRVALGLAPGADLADAMWDALLASVALRDRYLLPTV